MKRKYAVEDLDNYINEWAGIRPQENWLTFSEVEDALMKIIELSELPQDAARELRLFFDENPYMHGELGEVEGHSYYEDAIYRFIEAFKEKFGEDALDKINF